MVGVKTKCDISGGEITLDYKALIYTANIASKSLKKEIRELLDKLDAADASETLCAEWMDTCMSALRIVTETRHTLVCGQDREEVIITNRKEGDE